ncbi:MAG: hypothetical protein RL281_551, partial [Pseudomonadota bacterium]
MKKPLKTSSKTAVKKTSTPAKVKTAAKANKKPRNKKLKMSYGLKQIVENAPQKLLQEYNELVNKNAFLKIGYGFRSGSRLHIGCLKSVIIGNNVLIASDVFISDHSHGNYGESDCD